MPKEYDCPVKAAKAYAKAHGYQGRAGGWIYRLSTGRPVCQGWADFARICQRRGWVVFTRWCTYTVPVEQEAAT